MATASAKVDMNVIADARIQAAVDVIAAHIGIDPLSPVSGRILDPEMRVIKHKEALADWLDRIVAALVSNATAPTPVAQSAVVAPTDTEKAVIEMTTDEVMPDEEIPDSLKARGKKG